jgi:hypothetical protein
VPAKTPAVAEISVLSRSARVDEARSLWVHGVAWDAFWLQSALWLAPLALLLAYGYEDPGESPLDFLIFGLTALFWISHRFSSTWLAYATTAYRPLLHADPVRFVIVPIAIAAVCFATLLPADDALPFTRSERVALATLDFVLVTYHFAAQHFGVLSLYRVRSGRSADVWTRRLDRLFALGVGGALVVVVEAVLQTTLFQEGWLATWLDAGWLDDASGPLRIVATTLVIALTLALLASEARAPSTSFPRVLYVVGVAVMVTIGLHTDHPWCSWLSGAPNTGWRRPPWPRASLVLSRLHRARPPGGRCTQSTGGHGRFFSRLACSPSCSFPSWRWKRLHPPAFTTGTAFSGHLPSSCASRNGADATGLWLRNRIPALLARSRRLPAVPPSRTDRGTRAVLAAIQIFQPVVTRCQASKTPKQGRLPEALETNETKTAARRSLSNVRSP